MTIRTVSAGAAVATLPHVRCPLCGDDRLITHEWQTSAMPLLACRECGLVFLGLTLDAEEIHGIYEDDYFGHWGPDPQRGPVWDMKAKSSRGYLRRALPLLAAPAGRRPRLLDIGCAHGWMLATAERAGFEAHGLEIAPDAFAAAVGLGFNVRQSRLEDSGYPASFF